VGGRGEQRGTKKKRKTKTEHRGGGARVNIGSRKGEKRTWKKKKKRKEIRNNLSKKTKKRVRLQTKPKNLKGGTVREKR